MKKEVIKAHIFVIDHDLKVLYDRCNDASDYIRLEELLDKIGDEIEGYEFPTGKQGVK